MIPPDVQYLNLALFIQQLESAFFERGLSRYSQADFVKAGFPDWVRGRYMQIAEHEKTRLDFLQSAVTSSGRDHVAPSDYQFSDNDVHAFIDLSEAITTIVAGSYVGGLHYFSNREYVTVGASILSVESRQASWINSAVRKQHPWNTAFETPLSPNQVLTLLTSFFDFDKMPAQNRALLPANLRPYPRLWLAPRLVPGQEAEISFQNPNVQKNERLYAAFLFGFETIFAPITEREDTTIQGADAGHDNRKYFVQIPKDLDVKGTVFVVVLKGTGNISEVRLDDQSTVAGPAIAMFSFGANHAPILW
ncbi:hypothetical protein GALMADRAFT_81121 [Galerina marginata CBS 339.88]|uniref:Uncharacterized protein n=1 Tax=Galerina marginata (strain CBS 339.88) TaxID=685588 RepID=A0A067SHQ5_GALM3|nr:hypothetical protein GALMADRAFT_81121 [Galerina marginata CBS 339.88]